jgi:hypothetical protein
MKPYHLRQRPRFNLVIISALIALCNQCSHNSGPNLFNLVQQTTLISNTVHIYTKSVLQHLFSALLRAAGSVGRIRTLIELLIIDSSILITYPNIPHHHYTLCTLPIPCGHIPLGTMASLFITPYP